MAFALRSVGNVATVVAVSAVTVIATTATRAPSAPGANSDDVSALSVLDWRTLDGSNNNHHPAWGQALTPYSRVAAPSYADGISRPVSGPAERYVSNRVFNDTGQNLFSENGVSQWAGYGARSAVPAGTGPDAVESRRVQVRGI